MAHIVHSLASLTRLLEVLLCFGQLGRPGWRCWRRLEGREGLEYQPWHIHGHYCLERTCKQSCRNFQQHVTLVRAPDPLRTVSKRSALILVSGTCWRLVPPRSGSAIQYVLADVMNMEMRPVHYRHMDLSMIHYQARPTRHSMCNPISKNLMLIKKYIRLFEQISIEPIGFTERENKRSSSTIIISRNFLFASRTDVFLLSGSAPHSPWQPP
jgi:hypothetical protein